VKIGIEFDWQRARFDINRDRIRLCDELGYDVAFCAEKGGSDAISPLGFILGFANRLGVGTRIAQNVARTPTTLAMTFQTMRQMCPDRQIIAGVGSSNPMFTEQWHGVPWSPAYWRMRDYVTAMRKYFDGELVEVDGRAITIPYHPPGEAPKHPALPPVLETDPTIPIVFGGGTELMLTLAAEIGDGLMPNGGWWPGARSFYQPIIDRGFARRTRPARTAAQDFPIWAHVDLIVSDDIKAAMREFKVYTAKWTGFHVGKGGHHELMTFRGWGREADRVQELYRAGRIREAEDAVPDDYIDQCWLVGPVERIVERWRKYWIDDGCNLIVRTDNWPGAKPAGDEIYAPLMRALRE